MMKGEMAKAAIRNIQTIDDLTDAQKEFERLGLRGPMTPGQMEEILKTRGLSEQSEHFRKIICKI